jgi:fibronectin type 3 domain-containing protein
MLALMFCSCGKKGDPGLPMPIVPDAPSRFQAVARSEGIFILWRAPDQNVNDTPLIDLAGFRILRANEPIDKLCPKCPKNVTQLADIAYKGDRGKVPDNQQYYYQDTALEFGMAYFYKMMAYNEREKEGKPTKHLVVFWDQPPAVPAGFKVVRKDKALMFSWQPVTTLEGGSPLEGFYGYNIYRTARQGIYDEAPINSEPVLETRYEDVPEKIDETYFYTVRAARMVRETMVESAPSSELQVAYMDITPPGVPTGLTAIPRAAGVELKWIGIFQQEITGYNIYRRDAGGGFVRLNGRPVTDTSWLDTSAKSGGSYVYCVTSVDASARANESPMSEPASVTFKLQ